MRRLALLPLLALALVAGGCGDDEEQGDGGGGEQATQQQTTPASGCRQVGEPPAKEEGGERKPRQKLDADRTYSLTFETNCGAFTIRLDPESAPNAAASLWALARADFFDDTTFHRIVPGFVIQGGDPTATGTGGPGYQTVDKPPADARYTKGVVAMAKAGPEKPGTAGSQFFVVTGTDAGLPPDFAIVGEVTDGQDVVERIGALGGPDERPTEPVVVTDVKAEEES